MPDRVRVRSSSYSLAAICFDTRLVVWQCESRIIAKDVSVVSSILHFLHIYVGVEDAVFHFFFDPFTISFNIQTVNRHLIITPTGTSIKNQPEKITHRLTLNQQGRSSTSSSFFVNTTSAKSHSHDNTTPRPHNFTTTSPSRLHPNNHNGSPQIGHEVRRPRIRRQVDRQRRRGPRRTQSYFNRANVLCSGPQSILSTTAIRSGTTFLRCFEVYASIVVRYDLWRAVLWWEDWLMDWRSRKRRRRRRRRS